MDYICLTYVYHSSAVFCSLLRHTIQESGELSVQVHNLSQNLGLPLLKYLKEYFVLGIVKHNLTSPFMEDLCFSLKCVSTLNPLLDLQGVNFKINVFIVLAIKYLCE